MAGRGVRAASTGRICMPLLGVLGIGHLQFAADVFDTSGHLECS